MDISQSIFLGLVQGLGEFLPISSSAHLILTPWLFGWQDQGLAYDLALHLGTLTAVGVYFRKDLFHLIRGFVLSLYPGTRAFSENIYQKLSWYIALATLPAVLVGWYLEKIVETMFRQPLIIAGTLSGFGIVLFFIDKYGKKDKSLNNLTAKRALIVGCAQVLALIPGVSRSGSTIAAGLALNLKREDAARFSFLMSVPITLGAILVKLSDFVLNASFLAGFLSSAICGFLAIKYLLKYIGQHNFNIFVMYRLVLALGIVLIYWLR